MYRTICVDNGPRVFLPQPEGDWSLSTENGNSWQEESRWIPVEILREMMSVAFKKSGFAGEHPQPLYQTFFPKSEKDGPVFNWMVVRRNGSLLIHDQDIAYCPFPTVLDTKVLRTSVRPEERIFFPACWCRGVARFASMGIVGMSCMVREGSIYYYGSHFSGKKIEVESEEVWNLLPKGLRQEAILA